MLALSDTFQQIAFVSYAFSCPLKWHCESQELHFNLMYGVAVYMHTCISQWTSVDKNKDQSWYMFSILHEMLISCYPDASMPQRSAHSPIIHIVTVLCSIYVIKKFNSRCC